MKRRFGVGKWAGLLLLVSMGTTSVAEYERDNAPMKKLDNDCLTTVSGGDIQGIDRGDSCAYLSIPYAAPPVGALRWKPPQPAAPWAPSVIASPPNWTDPAVRPVCPQRSPNQGSEDCLKLFVFAPSPLPHKAPVLVYFHTGRFIAAAGSNLYVDGERIAEKTGAIVVTLNYRLGPFGFMAHSLLTAEDPAYPSSGNYGMLDQRLAMQWVHDNVEAFGGDNTRIAIAGISAGGESASAHVVSPGSAGLFKRAILQSGPFTHRIDTLAEREAQGAVFATRVGCTTGDILACMRLKTRDEVLNALALDAGGWAEAGGVRWSPVVDGLELPDQPRTLYEMGAFNNVRVIVGSARDDGFAGVNRSFPSSITEAQYVAALNTEFGPYAADVLAQYPSFLYASPKEALSAVASDFGYICEARRIARLTARPDGEDTDGPDDLDSDDDDKSAYLYSFERITTDPLHVLHGTDHPFLFGNLYVPTGFDPNLDPNNIALFQSMAGYWARFAEKGKPNHGNDGAVNWPAYGVGEDPDRNLALNVPITVNFGYRDTQCSFWDGFFFRHPFATLPAAAP